MKFYTRVKLSFLMTFCLFNCISSQKLTNVIERLSFVDNCINLPSLTSSRTGSQLKEMLAHVLNNQYPRENNVPEEVNRCYKALQENAQLVKIEDLLVTLIFIINHKAPGILSHEHIRAPRPTTFHDNNPIVEPLISCDLDQLMELLEFLRNIIIFCCDQLEQDFENFFFTLTVIINNLNTYCNLITATSSFETTFTALQDIKNTLTTCCANITLDFEATWTILAAGFSATFTEISDIKNTLTACCDQIQKNFQATFTALNILETITCVQPCGPIPITQPIIITIPGLYCLAKDIVGPIIINASNVTLDLNNHTISGSGPGSGTGIIVNSGTNRTIHNGRIVNFDTGIMSTNNITTVLSNIVISVCFIEGITINNGTDIHLDSLITRDIRGIGVHLTGINNTYLIKNILINNAQQGFIFDTISNSLILNCEVADCISPLSAAGYAINSGSFNQFDHCSVKNLVSMNKSVGFFLLNSTNTILSNCTVQNSITQVGPSAEGFECNTLSNDSALLQCSALNINAPIFTAGFALEGNTITVIDGLAQECLASNLNGNGFVCTGSNIALTSCQAYSCESVGFSITSTDITLQYCQSGYNDIGFLINNSNVLIGNSIAVNNSSIGFDNNFLTLAIYHCFASHNGLNNYVGIPNVQNANTQVDNAAPGITGPFAGVNLFI